MGRWETTYVDYADRYFELSATGLVLGTGGTTFQRHLIAEIRRRTDVAGIFYTLTYLDTIGNENTMGFIFDNDQGGRIRLRNQIHVEWRKVRR